MKKISVIIAVVIAAVSCLGPSNYSQSWTSIASFEYTSDQAELFGADSLYHDETQKLGIGWEYFAFYQNVDKASAEFKGGFMLSYLSPSSPEKAVGLQNNHYRVNSKSATKEQNTYIVFHQTEQMPEKDMAFTFIPSGTSTGMCIMSSCYVNNTVAVAKNVEETFVSGDKLMLKARGFLNGKETGAAEITLAEKTTSKDSIMYNWTQFDLSKLGAIDKVDFEIVGPEGKIEIPTVCIDNVIANISLTY